MIIGKVVKRIISTVKNEAFNGRPLLLVQPMTMNMEKTGNEVLCIDFMGADVDELVMFMKEGSGVNQLLGVSKAPADAAIVGIVDSITLEDRKVFEKSSAEAV